MLSAGAIGPPPDWLALLSQTRDLLMPEVILAMFGLLALVLPAGSLGTKFAARASRVGVALAGISLGVQAASQWPVLPVYGLAGAIVLDEFSFFVRAALLVALGLAMMLSAGASDDEPGAESHGLMALATVGMMTAVGGADLVTLCVALELASLSAVVLVALEGRGRESAVDRMQLYAAGAFSSAIVLYGLSLVYGATGVTALRDLDPALLHAATPVAGLRYLLVSAAVLSTAGIVGKIVAAPIALRGSEVRPWVLAFLVMGLTTAFAGCTMRLLLAGLPSLRSVGPLPGWGAVLGVAAAAMLAWGAHEFWAWRSDAHVLAAATVSHAGLLILGILAGSRLGFVGTAFALAAFVPIAAGASAVAVAVRQSGGAGNSLEGYTGLAKRTRLLGHAATICMLGLCGIPTTAGFVGKFIVGLAVARSGDAWLIALGVLGALNAIASTVACLRFVRAVYAREADDASSVVAPSTPVLTTIVLAAIVTVAAGVFPQPLIGAAEAVVRRFDAAPSPFSSGAP